MIDEKKRRRQLLGAYLDFFIHTITKFCPEKCAEINMQTAMDFCDDWITQEIKKVDKGYGQIEEKIDALERPELPNDAGMKKWIEESFDYFKNICGLTWKDVEIDISLGKKTEKENGQTN